MRKILQAIDYKKIAFCWVTACVMLSLATFSDAQARSRGFDNSKYAMLVIDGSTGTVLYQKNAGKYRYPASLTKLMTLYLTFDALENGKLHPHTQLYVSRHAAAQSPSKLGLKAGSKISVKDAMMALVIKSANDAAVVLAEGLGGTESQFAVKMTKKAKKLGMKHTVFRNASGLPNRRQKTTAYDMARLAMSLYTNHRKYYPLFSQNSYRFRGRTLTTHNRVTKNYRGADGLKTGYINASGFNLVTSAKRGNKRIVGVVMGGRTARGRDNHMISLLDKGFAKIKGTGNFPLIFANKEPVPSWKPGTDRAFKIATAPLDAIPTQKPLTIGVSKAISAPLPTISPSAKLLKLSKNKVKNSAPSPKRKPHSMN